ncbi:HPr-rel-A system PqqD family peptide chaperone [Azohydromonas sediminis]|uniref:HPr-rel-A system PqqD family peptide chaperone n=1 Tax=Azohydromonas sediminis TaxID=2259674 RepID=UPI0013C2EA38|nr:HPr-rel-A system PqqD family peptide chaperone [Azohydromonas sediminis]
MSDAAEPWRLNPTAQWHWRDWGADSVVIEVRSGDTHLLDPLSAAVMACIESGACCRGELLAMLRADLDVDAVPEFSQTLETILEKLFRLGWIEPKPGAA